MRNLMWLCILLLVTDGLIQPGEGFKILGVFQVPSKSHFLLGDVLMSNLAQRGHEVTVISPYPMGGKKYRGIELPSLISSSNNVIKDFLKLRHYGFIDYMTLPYKFGEFAIVNTLSHPAVQKFFKSNQTFDVIIHDAFGNEAIVGVSEIFNAPLIAFCMFGASMWNTEIVGTPLPPSYVPTMFTSLTNRMNFWERTSNLFHLISEKLYLELVHLPAQEELFKKYFANVNTSMRDLTKRTALALLNQQASLTYSRPSLPNMIEVGGLHLNKEAKPLPNDIKTILDNATDGAIYFSLGTNAKSSNLPIEKYEAILKVFKAIKQRVLWKFEGSRDDDLSDNVYIRDWFPQHDILAHPNVKIFITHGGLLSLTEAIHYGKPVIGIPIFGDQFMNIAQAEANGYAVKVDYNMLDELHLKNAIEEIINNPKYTRNVQQMSATYHDRPMTPIDLATFWVEYVARHKGAQHLYCSGQELNFFQYHNIDVLAFLAAGVLLAVYIIVKLILKVISTVFSKSKNKTD